MRWVFSPCSRGRHEDYLNFVPSKQQTAAGSLSFSFPQKILNLFTFVLSSHFVGSFTFTHSKSSDLHISFFGTVLKEAYTCRHMFLPHSLLPPTGKFRLRKQKSSGKYQNQGKTICLITHSTKYFLGICCVYKMVSYSHACNLCLSENQI